MSQLTFLGTSDAFNDGGRANACYWVDDTLGSYAVDFGPSALLQCARLGLDPDRLDAVFLTHLHGDHTGGMAALLLHLQFKSRRTRPLIIAGPAGMEERIGRLRESAYPSLARRGLPFPIIWRRWRVPGTVEVLGRTVRTIRARHDLMALATSFRVEGGGPVLSFSGDTGWHSALAELVAGSAIFVCECSDVRPGYWAHTSLEELRGRRAEIVVGRLVLSHLGAASRRAAEAEAEALELIVADDGLVLSVR